MYSVSFCTSIKNLIESLVSHSSLAKMPYLSEISCSQNTTLRWTNIKKMVEKFFFVTLLVSSRGMLDSPASGGASG